LLAAGCRSNWNSEQPEFTESTLTAKALAAAAATPNVKFQADPELTTKPPENSLKEQTSSAAAVAEIRIVNVSQSAALAAATKTGEELPLPKTAPVPVVPPTIRSLTLEQLYSLTLSQHPLLAARRNEIDAARGRLIQAGLWPNPSIVLDTENELTPVSNSTDITGRVMFTLPLGQKIERRQAAAQAEIVQARSQFDADAQLLLTITIDAAYETRYYQELLENNRVLQEFSEKAAKIQQARVDARLGTVALVRVNAWSSNVERYDVEAKLRLAQLRLSRAIGQNPPQPLHIVEPLRFAPLNELSLSQITALAQDAQPRIAAARGAWLTRQRELAVAWGDAIPDLQLGPRYRGDTHDNGDAIGARVQFDLPIYNRNQGAILAAAATARAAAAQVTLAQLESVNDVLSAYEQVQVIAKNLHAYQELVEPAIREAEKNLALASEQQAVEAWQVVEAQIRIIKLRNDYLNLVYLYNLNVARLELFLGRKLRAE